MAAGRKPPAELDIDIALVQALLREQHADLAGLPLTEVGEGWDNRLFRLGADLVVRLPRRGVSAVLIEHEQRWLPRLAARLPLPVPVPHRIGRPGCGFPWAWSVTPWIAGKPALVDSRSGEPANAALLGAFLRALHQPATHDAPANRWRGVPLAAREETWRTHVRQLGRFVETKSLHETWARALRAPPWNGPPLWIHGDLHPGNLLVRDGRLAGVIDFGDLTAGDPATDLALIWMLPARSHSEFAAALGAAYGPVDTATMIRARGWALALGMAFAANSRDDAPMRAMGLATIEAALSADA